MPSTALTMPRGRGRLSRRAPLATPLPLVPLPAGEPPLDASAVAPLLLLPPLAAAAWLSTSWAAPASASSSAFTAAAAGEGWLREGGMRPKVCWIRSLVCCVEEWGRGESS